MQVDPPGVEGLVEDNVGPRRNDEEALSLEGGIFGGVLRPVDGTEKPLNGRGPARVGARHRVGDIQRGPVHGPAQLLAAAAWIREIKSYQRVCLRIGTCIYQLGAATKAVYYAIGDGKKASNSPKSSRIHA